MSINPPKNASVLFFILYLKTCNTCALRKRFTNFAGYKYRLKAFILSLGIIWLMILVEVVSYGRQDLFLMGVLMQGGVAKEKVNSYFTASRGWHHCVCFSTNVYGLHTCGDAEACLSSFHFYLRLWLSYLVKKITLKNISNVFVNKLHAH